MGNGMSATRKNLVEETRIFHINKQLAYAVSLWEQGENDTVIVDGVDVPGVLPGGDNAGKPVFQHDLQESLPMSSGMKIKSPENGGTLVLETGGDFGCKAFMPGGFRGGPTPNGMNPYRMAIGSPDGSAPQNCATSWGHILVIPKNYRLWNVVTLTQDHIPLLEEMDRVGRLALKILLEGDANMVGSLRWAMAQDSTITLNDGTNVSTKLQADDFLDDEAFLECQQNGVDSVVDMVNDTIESTFHVGRAASISWLHLHVRPTCFDLVSKAGMDSQAEDNGYVKQTPLSDVIEFLKSEELATIRAQAESLNSEPEPESDDDDDDGNTLSRQQSVRR